MASAKGIIDEIRRLPARERQIVIKHLEQMKTRPGPGPKGQARVLTRPNGGARGRRPSRSRRSDTSRS